MRKLENKLRHQVGKAIADFAMIKDGDRILVGASGGKDSLLLLHLLRELQRRAPIKFTIFAATLDLGWSADFSGLADYCSRLGFPYQIISSKIGKDIGENQIDSSPCSICSHLRRGAINNLAQRLGCNKVAYAHHADDAAETLLLNLFFAGKIACFKPVTFLSRQEITVIRPMIYVREVDISIIAEHLRLPIVSSGCPWEGKGARSYIKSWLSQTEVQIPALVSSVLSAMQNQDIQLWHDNPQ